LHHKAAGQEKLGLARSAARDAEALARQTANDVEAELQRSKAGVEKVYAEGRDSVEERASEAKSGLFNWLGSGRAKADESKKEAAAKVAGAAEDLKKSTGRHS
jgi:hypothetical protein